MTDSSLPPFVKTEHDQRVWSAIDLYTGLLDGLLGEKRAKKARIDLRVLAEFYTLSDPDRWVISHLVDAMREARALRKYTARDVAAVLKVEPSTVKRLARQGRLEGDFVEGRWMFTEKQVERFIEANTHYATE